MYLVNRMSKYSIRFMPDYYSTSLWPESKSSYEEFESPISYEALNLSSDLIKDLKAFDNSLLNILDWTDPAAPSPLGEEEGIQIYNEGQRLLKLVRQELGSDFEVIDCLEWIYPEKERMDKSVLCERDLMGVINRSLKDVQEI